ncbi:Conserved oligomeric Golgi complex subunit 3 [Galdieria sulphuraria]|uniref:Sec34-like family protein isoform 1 n=1 Tax=Galdieria sulphuraria TaxID=130081 RepID=M2Y679_GALSU|nr:sec34-like family protein isoform 1 [Galdieria sulphuraria]EME31339.1 sec34-like family protein isoform 1 [Galdieria sulphuraria]GJD07228.1 Conserved oligomeric Golgi complex subunit 3 [Galdieria sulphuraria]|eukprot:XP_005707859.1 sec34-like family protein isoform 1 [Galdieria sulphuraria]
MESFTFQEFSQLQKEWKELQLSLEEQEALVRIQKKLQSDTQDSFSSSHEDQTNDSVLVETSTAGDKPFTVEALNDQLLQIKNLEDFHCWSKNADNFLTFRGNKPLAMKREELEQKMNRCHEMREILENLKKQLQVLGNETSFVTTCLESFLNDMGATTEQYGYSTELLHVLSERLSSLDLLESTTQLLSQKQLSPTESEFWKRLKQVENILKNIISSHAQVSEADEFLVNLMDLELELFDQIRYHFQSFMSQTCVDTFQAYRNWTSDIRNSFRSLNSELHHNSSLYSYFRSTCSKTKSWMVALESRVNHGIIVVDTISNRNSLGVIIQSRLQKGAEKVLMECQDVYLKERQKVVEQIFFQSFYEFRTVQDISQMARNSGSMLIKLLQMEQDLFESYFDFNETCGKYLATMLDAFGSHFYYTWRPRIIEEQHLSRLVDIVEIFRSEILPEDKASDNMNIAKSCSKRILQRTIADAQERITYLTQIYIRNEIQSYSFTREDMNRCCFFSSSESREVEPSREETMAIKRGTNYKEAVLPFSCWYPPVDRTLKLLAMLYRRMTSEVFSGLAEEIVSSCVSILILSSQQVRQSLSMENSEEHSMLFLMSQLWVLREQIQPFDADFSYQEKFLNLSELRNSMMRMIWRTKSHNEVFSQEPHRQIIHDSKRSLEEELKKACSNYIMFLCNTFLEPLLSLLSEMNTLSSRQGTSLSTSIEKTSPLRQNSIREPTDAEEKISFDFNLSSPETVLVDPESIKHAWSHVWRLLEQKFPLHIQLFKRYIRSPNCQEQILFSVCSNTSTSCMELMTILQTKYTLEQREQIAIDGICIQQLVSRVKEICGFAE